jgi:hypothetical protein
MLIQPTYKPVNPYPTFVVNSLTGAWCTYTGWDALDYAVFKNRLFFLNGNGGVMEAEVGGNDNGEPVRAAMVLPFAVKGSDVSSYKQAQLMRVFLEADIEVEPLLSVSADYVLQTPTFVPVNGTQPSDTWGLPTESRWDSAIWTGGTQSLAVFDCVEGAGFVLAPQMHMAVQMDVAPNVYLNHVELVMNVGGAVV